MYPQPDECSICCVQASTAAVSKKSQLVESEAASRVAELEEQMDRQRRALRYVRFTYTMRFSHYFEMHSGSTLVVLPALTVYEDHPVTGLIVVQGQACNQEALMRWHQFDAIPASKQADISSKHVLKIVILRFDSNAEHAAPLLHILQRPQVAKSCHNEPRKSCNLCRIHLLS